MDENLNKPAFSATKKELIAALASYFVSYIYAAFGFNFTGAWPLIFAAGYIALVEYLCAGRPRGRFPDLRLRAHLRRVVDDEPRRSAARRRERTFSAV